MVGRGTDLWYRSNHPQINQYMIIPLALAKAQINCLIWGYDAAIFIKKPRDINFSAELHLLVADADIQSAAGVIFKSFLYLQPFSDCCPFPVEKNIHDNGTTGVSTLDIPQGHGPDMLQYDHHNFSPPTIPILLQH